MTATIIAILILAVFEMYSIYALSAKMNKLAEKVDFLEETPNRLRKIPKELEDMPWTSVKLKDGTELCMIKKTIEDNEDAIYEMNRIKDMLGKVHASIYEPGTWIKTPASDPATFSVMWYKDINACHIANSNEIQISDAVFSMKSSTSWMESSTN